jgi:hypothetical protein
MDEIGSWDILGIVVALALSCTFLLPLRGDVKKKYFVKKMGCSIAPPDTAT